jgi:DNA ligase-1
MKFPVLGSSKIDGARLIARQTGLWTRNGKEYVSVPHIANILKPVFDKHPLWVIDGEAFSSLVPFEEIMSLVKKKKPTSEDLEESAKYVQYFIFDGLTDINKGFTERFQEIKNEIQNLVGKNSIIVFVENENITNHAEIETKHDEYVAKGAEGLMIRVPNALYENKRTKVLLKYKHFFDAEFPIVDILEGQGNRSGMAGKLVIKLKDGRTQEAGIRGGEVYYRRLFRDRAKLIGKLATIRYQNFTDDGKMRFPVAINIDPIDR